MNERLNNWIGYWQMYDILCLNIKSENQQLAKWLIDAKSHVNGSTDGRQAFLNLFKELIFNHSGHLSSDCKAQANSLISQLENALAPQSKYGGMTVNERLVIANKMNEFDDAIDSKDIPKITEILRSVELSDSDINTILKNFKLSSIQKGENEL